MMEFSVVEACKLQFLGDGKCGSPMAEDLGHIMT